ncbi:MAG: DegQ family serine endoprotease [Psychromonas sp.]|nr:DegQ family serine endoprotease [Psychromonas sp.]
MKKIIYSFICISCLLTSVATTATAFPFVIESQCSSSLAPLVNKVSPAVVNISVLGKQFSQSSSADLFDFFNPYNDFETQPQPFFGLGSGVIIDANKGYIITNYHVIEDTIEIKVTLNTGQEFIAQIIGQDKESDIALLQINTTKKLTQIKLANSDNLQVGDFVIAIGNPFGLGQTVTSGIISALGRSGLNLDNLENFIQTDAAINTGNSGGALVNIKGELIGINTAILGSNGANIGIGFAIPSNMVNSMVQQLLLYGEIRRGVLGIRGEELTPALAEVFSLDSPNGAFIKQVNPDSAAEEAGLNVGDVIISMNNRAINSFAELRAQIGSLSIGTKIKLGVIRNGEKININARLKASQQHKVPAKSFHPSLEGATLSNIKDNKGVIITNVQQGSISESYGLQENDLIIGINRIRIHNLDELKALLKTSPSLLAINIQRDKRLLYLILN